LTVQIPPPTLPLLAIPEPALRFQSKKTCLLALLLLLPSLAHADEPPPSGPVILGGRESAVEHLFDPYTSEHEVADGWLLGDMHINRTVIDAQLQRGAEKATLLLAHPRDPASRDHVVMTLQSQSFALYLMGPESVRAAGNKLAQAVIRNDHGGFWSEAVAKTPPPTFLARVWRFVTDAVFLTALAILGLILHLRRVLQPLPRQATWWLLGLTVAGILLRALIAVPIIMNGWPYLRIVPAVRMMAEGVILPAILQQTGTHIAVFDAMFHFDFLIACLTPAAIFAHARYVLGDWRSAMAAATLFAVLPLHIRFSHADTELILTLGLSSLSFLALYASLRAERRFDRWLARPLLLILGLTSYFVRPEAVALAGVDMGAILLTAGVGVPMRRRIGAAMIVLASAIWLFVDQGERFFGRVKDAGEANPLLIGLRSIADPTRNPIIDPWITPPLLVFLMGAGVWWLWRTARGKAVYLTGWLVGMFFIYYVHGIPAMQARYHLSLATPFVILGGASLPWLLTWKRVWLRNAVMVGALLSPLLHLNFERDVDYTEMHEFEFVRNAAKLVPDGCTVVEYVPTRDPENRQRHLHGRWDAVGRDINGKGMTQRWPIVDAEDWLQNPPAVMPKCVYYYDGLTCRSHRPLDLPLAPMCQSFRQMSQQTVAQETLPFRFYDILHAGPFDPSAVTKRRVMKQRIPQGESIPVALMRVR
jgi:hypothetical protein